MLAGGSVIAGVASSSGIASVCRSLRGDLHGVGVGDRRVRLQRHRHLGGVVRLREIISQQILIRHKSDGTHAACVIANHLQVGVGNRVANRVVSLHRSDSQREDLLLRQRVDGVVHHLRSGGHIVCSGVTAGEQHIGGLNRVVERGERVVRVVVAGNGLGLVDRVGERSGVGLRGLGLSLRERNLVDAAPISGSELAVDGDSGSAVITNGHLHLRAVPLFPAGEFEVRGIRLAVAVATQRERVVCGVAAHVCALALCGERVFAGFEAGDRAGHSELIRSACPEVERAFAVRRVLRADFHAGAGEGPVGVVSLIFETAVGHIVLRSRGVHRDRGGGRMVRLRGAGDRVCASAADPVCGGGVPRHVFSLVHAILIFSGHLCGQLRLHSGDDRGVVAGIVNGNRHWRDLSERVVGDCAGAQVLRRGKRRQCGAVKREQCLIVNAGSAPVLACIGWVVFASGLRRPATAVFIPLLHELGVGLAARAHRNPSGFPIEHAKAVVLAVAVVVADVIDGIGNSAELVCLALRGNRVCVERVGRHLRRHGVRVAVAVFERVCPRSLRYHDVFVIPLSHSLELLRQILRRAMPERVI